MIYKLPKGSMHMRTMLIFLAVFFITLPAYCGTNFSPKNIKDKNKATSRTTATIKTDVKEVQKASIPAWESEVKKEVKPQAEKQVEKSEVKKEVKTKAEKQAYGGDGEIVSTSPYSGQADKALLDEKTRSIQVPREGGVGYGVMREKMVRVKLDSNIAYDDNIFLTKDNTQHDIVSTISPGVYGYIGNDQYTAMGFYEAEVLIYARNGNEDRVNQVLGGRVDLFKQGRIKLSVQDALRPTTDPATSEVAPFVKRVNNDFTANVRYDISPKTSLAITYDQYMQYYITESYKQFSYIQHTVSPVVYYHITPKISLTGEYNLGMTNYMGGANYNSLFNQVRFGVEGTLSPKSRVYLRAGYQYRHYYDSDSKNTQGGVLQLGYDYLISPKTSLNLIASSDINESVWNYNPYYNSYNFYASLTHHILYNLDVSVNGLYLISNYPHDVNSVDGMRKRSDNLYGAGARVSYNMRTWLSAYAAYDFKYRNSNIRDLSYTDDIISGGLRLSF